MLRDTLEHVGWAFGQVITENVILFIHCHDNRNLLNIKNINRYVANSPTGLLENGLRVSEQILHTKQWKFPELC